MNYMDMEVFLQKERRNSRYPIKLTHPFPAPETAGKTFYRREVFF